jgi:hypothetical protein
MWGSENRKSKLIAGVAVLGLLIGFSATKAGAQLGNANYIGRYACTATDNIIGNTAVIKYGPNGAGAYEGGTLTASGTPFTGSGFCVYDLNLAASSYTIGTDGTGFEKLTWTASATNAPGCPPTFVDQTAIALSTNLNTGGATLQADFTDADLLGASGGAGEVGYGYCVK